MTTLTIVPSCSSAIFPTDAFLPKNLLGSVFSPSPSSSLPGPFQGSSQVDNKKEEKQESGESEEKTRCTLCLDYLPADQFVKPFRCRYHNFCKECITRMFTVHINEGGLEDLICPNGTCKKKQVLTNFIQDLVSPATFERFLTVSFNRALDSMPDLAWCPKCQSPVIGDNQGYGHCSKCEFCFCLACNETWHVGRCATDNENDEEVEEIAPKRKEKIFGSKDPLTIQDKMLFATTTKRCPNCLIHIEKNGGCSHMHCRRCDTHFQWEQALPSSHNTSEVRKKFYKELEREARHAEMEKKKLERERLALEKKNRVRSVKDPNARKCPGCRSLVTKTTNSNYLRCESCKKAFCFQCGGSIQGTLHFQPPSSCKQHSPLVPSS